MLPRFSNAQDRTTTENSTSLTCQQSAGKPPRLKKEKEKKQPGRESMASLEHKLVGNLEALVESETGLSYKESKETKERGKHSRLLDTDLISKGTYI